MKKLLLYDLARILFENFLKSQGVTEKDFMYQPHKRDLIKCQYAILGSGENGTTVVLIDERDGNAGSAKVVLLKRPLEFNKNKEVEGLEEYAFIEVGFGGSHPNSEKNGMVGSDTWLKLVSHAPYLGIINIVDDKDWAHSKQNYYFKLTELANFIYHDTQYSWVTNFFKSNSGDIIPLQVRYKDIKEKLAV